MSQLKIGFAEPFLYYGRVGLNFVGQVATHQKLTVIPNVGTAMEGLGGFISALTNGSWKKVTLRQVGKLSIEGIKIYGFFLVGEMIGRGSIIGYQIPG